MRNVLAERMKSSMTKNDKASSLIDEVDELKSKLDREQLTRATRKFYDILRASKEIGIMPDAKEFPDYYNIIKINIMRPMVYGGF